MPSLTLTNATAVNRSADHTWSGLGAFPISSTGYEPSDTSYYVRFQIVPGGAFSYLPSALNLVIAATTSPSGDADCLVQDDTIRLGASGSPTGNNAALNAPVDGSREYIVDMPVGTTLSDFNAGNVYLWLGYTGYPDGYNPADLSITYTPDGVIDDNGSASAWAGNPPYAVDTGNLTPVPCYAESSGDVEIGITSSQVVAYLDIAINATGDSAAVGMPGTTNCSASASDSFGHSNSNSGETPRAAQVNTTNKVKVDLSGGAGSTTVSALGRSDVLAGVTGRCQASVDVSATGSNPNPSTITISSITISAPSGSGIGPSTSLVGGTIQGTEDEMTTAYLDDTLGFWAQTAEYASGVATDATGSPTYRVYEMTTGTPLLTGTLTIQDSGNTDGFYGASITLSSGSGFEVGKCYCIRVAATVATIDQAGIVEKFIIRDAPADVTGIWDYEGGAAEAGRADTAWQVIRQLWAWCYNRNQQQGSIQTVFLDDSSTPMLQGAFSASDTAVNKGKFE